MKTRPIFIIIALFTCAIHASANRIANELNGEWRFLKSDPGTIVADPAFDDSAWDTVQVPHSWNALDGQDGGGNYYRGPAWYRETFNVDAGWTGNRIFLKFHAAQTVADVYVNGISIGQHRGGYAAFVFDVTDAIIFGSINLLAVKVDNSHFVDVGPVSGDFTIGGGITRDVELLVLDPVHVSPLDYGSPGVYLTPSNVSETSANLEIKVVAANHDSVARSITLETEILDVADQVVDTLTSVHSLAAGADVELIQQTVVSNPHLWNGVADPYLYHVRVRLLDGASPLDEVVQPLGFRYFSVDPDQGFFLNGTYLDLHGINMHSERKDKGHAISDADREEDIAIAMDLGCTIVRLAHYQHADYKYTLCDETGLAVWAELAQVNKIYDTAAFTANAEQQLRELIRQNYNHPSIIFWSVSNEIDLQGGPDPTPLMQSLAAIVQSEDPTRLSTAAQAGTGSSKARNYNVDTYAMNTYHGWYYGTTADFETTLRSYHSSYPNDMVGISEYGAGASFDQHAYNPSKPSTTGPWHPMEWQNHFHEEHWLSMRTMPFLWTKLIWAGFDFASDGRNEGDAPGINDKGIISHDRTMYKDAYYWYRSHWNTEPLVHITSSGYDPAPGQTIPVKVYSNAGAVRLFLNGALVSETSSSENRFIWPDITLQVGTNTLTAVATFPSGDVSDMASFTYVADPPPEGDSMVAVTDGTANDYGKTSGVAIDFDASANLSADWIPDLSAGYAYRLDSLSLFLGNQGAVSEDLYLGVYTGLDEQLGVQNAATLSGFLGVSDNTFNLSTAPLDTALTWTFSGLAPEVIPEKTAGSGNDILYFVLQAGTNALADTGSMQTDARPFRRLDGETGSFSDALSAVIHGSRNNNSGSRDVVSNRALEYEAHLSVAGQSYESWISQFDTQGLDNRTDDVEPDGLNNELEYYLGGNPTIHDADSVMPKGIVVKAGASNTFEYVYRRRTDDPTLEYGLILSTNLVSGSWANIGQTYEVAPVGPTEDPDVQSVTNRIPIIDPVGFIRVEITDD